MKSNLRVNGSTGHRLLPWLAALFGGVLAFLGYVGYDQFYLDWICLVPVLWAIRDTTPGRAFLLGWVAGTAGHAGGFSWVVTLLRQFADAPLPLAVGGLLLLAAANGLVFAVWAWGTRRICRDRGWRAAWVAPVVWTAVEKFLPQIFPNYLGASQYKLLPLTQVADLAGILGVTFLLVYTNGVVYTIIEDVRSGRQRLWRTGAVYGAVLAIVLIYGMVRIHAVDREAAAAPVWTAGIVQTNRGAGDKHVDANLFLREHQEMSRELVRSQPLDILVWPESILGMDIASRTGAQITGLTSGLQTPLLFGAIIQTQAAGERRLYNSAVLVDGNGRITGTYDKTMLVPFGEFIPFGDLFPQFYAWSPYSGRFWRGENRDPIRLKGHDLSVNICYEDIFPVHVRMLMEGGSERRIPEALFNLTNDSWYGDTIQPLEHLVLASFRSIEHRRPLVRSTNTGISAIVDPVGRINVRTKQWTRASLTGRVPLMQGRTVYGILGDWLGWLCAAISLYGLSTVGRTKEA